MAVFNPFDFFLDNAEHYPFLYDAASANELRPFLAVPAAGPKLSAFLAGVSKAKIRTIDFLVALNQRVQSEIAYVTRMEHGVQTSRGDSHSSQRFLPRFGVAAGGDSAPSGTRGAICLRLSDSTPGRREAARRPGRPHCGFYRSACVGRSVSARRRLGWLGSHVRIARRRRSHPARLHARSWKRRADQRRAFGLRNTEFSHEMTVQRIYETPRVTKPYTEAQWREIETLGHLVDADLKAGDVRLTMGGEPTFVSLDDPDGSRVDHGSARSGETKASRRTAWQAARSFCSSCVAAFRPGEMVSRRTASSLGLWLLLAQRRRGDLGRRGFDR